MKECPKCGNVEEEYGYHIIDISNPEDDEYTEYFCEKCKHKWIEE